MTAAKFTDAQKASVIKLGALDGIFPAGSAPACEPATGGDADYRVGSNRLEDAPDELGKAGGLLLAAFARA